MKDERWRRHRNPTYIYPSPILYMKHLSLSTLILVLFSLIQKPASAQVNTEAVDAYWSIVDELKRDRAPSAQTWNAFFALQGNQLALKQARAAANLKDTVMKSLQLVYMPSHRQRLAQTPINPFLENILYVRDREDAIKDYIAHLKKAPVVDSMYRLAHQYLPPEKQVRLPGLKIYYVGPVTLDSRALTDAFFINTGSEHRFSPRRLPIIGAHELHHMLISLEKPKKATSNKYAGLMSVLRSLLTEGVADLIDKKYILAQNDTLYRPLLQQGLDISDSLLRRMNNELESLCASEGYRHNLRNFMARGGHVPGHYMALVIERNGLLPELLHHIDNPFAFVYIYNKGAKRDAARPAVFSERAITFLKEVEQLYQ